MYPEDSGASNIVKNLFQKTQTFSQSQRRLVRFSPNESEVIFCRLLIRQFSFWQSGTCHCCLFLNSQRHFDLPEIQIYLSLERNCIFKNDVSSFAYGRSALLFYVKLPSSCHRQANTLITYKPRLWLCLKLCRISFHEIRQVFLGS